ncbi:hypothetical protein BC828DRAFT_379046 [Blastocladiella britannica]|nr:hypothetical protein BC828DRAFT_379046 [Blastocladiella britannica]
MTTTRSTVTASTTGTPATALVSQMQWTALQLTNTFRAGRSPLASPLCMSAKLNSAALQHAVEMAALHYLAHTSPYDHSTPADRVTSTHFVWNAVGENILYASAPANATLAIKLWSNSPGHAANMANSMYKMIGLAFADGKCPGSAAMVCTYWVQVFGTAMRANSESCLSPPTTTATAVKSTTATSLKSTASSTTWPKAGALVEPIPTIALLPSSALPLSTTAEAASIFGNSSLAGAFGPIEPTATETATTEPAAAMELNGTILLAAPVPTVSSSLVGLFGILVAVAAVAGVVAAVVLTFTPSRRRDDTSVEAAPKKQQMAMFGVEGYQGESEEDLSARKPAASALSRKSAVLEN